MSFIQYLNEIVSTMPKIAHKTECSLISLYARFIFGYITRRITLSEFQSFCFYKLSPVGMSEYLTSRQRSRIMKRINIGSTAADSDIFNQKNQFNKVFSEFVKRDWLYLPDSSDDEVLRFLEIEEPFLLKPKDGMQGLGIKLFHPGDITPEVFIETYRGQPFLLERIIAQHPAMARLNPTSVNTVRIVTVRYQNKLLILGAGLRCGSAGAFVDNYSSGGTAYPIDIETGVICAPGRCLRTESALIQNPSCGEIMPGFFIPHWDILLEQVTRAAYVPEKIGYVAWDIAITEDGVEFVEGNVDEPGVTIIQLNGGVYRKLRDFLNS